MTCSKETVGVSGAHTLPDSDPVIKLETLSRVKVENYFESAGPSEQNQCCFERADDSRWLPSNVPITEEVATEDVPSQDAPVAKDTDLCNDAGQSIQRTENAEMKLLASDVGSRKFVGHVPSDVNHHSRNFSAEKSSTIGKLNKRLSSPHTTEKRFTCNDCGCNFKQLYLLKVHIRSHTGEKPYACAYCDFRTSWSGNLTVHYRTHKGKEPYVCYLCNYRFSGWRPLRMHNARVHGGETPCTEFKCEECDFKTDASFALKQHLKTHGRENEKLFKCEDCSFKSMHLNSMTRHRKVHDLEEQYVCEDCGYRTSRSDTFQAHMRTHTGEKPFACDECDYACVQFSNMKRHRRLMHSHKKRCRQTATTGPTDQAS